MHGTQRYILAGSDVSRILQSQRGWPTGGQEGESKGEANGGPRGGGQRGAKGGGQWGAKRGRPMGGQEGESKGGGQRYHVAAQQNNTAIIKTSQKGANAKTSLLVGVDPLYATIVKFVPASCALGVILIPPCRRMTRDHDCGTGPSTFDSVLVTFYPGLIL